MSKRRCWSSGAIRGNLPGVVDTVPGVELDRLVDRHEATVGIAEGAAELCFRERSQQDQPPLVERGQAADAARYTDEQVEGVLQLYRRVFPNGSAAWGQTAKYWDFGRLRPWSCLTTDFHAVTPGQIIDFDAARRNWRSSGDQQQDGEDLVKLAREHTCGYSLGISPWTDSALQATVTPKTTKLIVLVGHDWYPIVPRRGPVEARPPLDSFRLLDSADALVRPYAAGIPNGEAFRLAGIGLLFLNLVPDFRQPNTRADGTFRFDGPGFTYKDCATGVRAALRLVQTNFRILHVVTWGKPAWEALRCFAADTGAKTMAITEAAQRGAEGVPWHLGQQTLAIHPFPHPSRSQWHLRWTTTLFDAYCKMWNDFLSRWSGLQH